jgi:hypothetical protein
VAVVVPDEGGEARTGGFRGGGAQPVFPWCCCLELVTSRQRARGWWTLRTGVTAYTGVPRPASDLAVGLTALAGVPSPALPLPPAGRPTSKLTAGLVVHTGLPRWRRRFRLQDIPPDVAASACRTPGVRAHDRTRHACRMPPLVSSLPPAVRLALELVVRIRRACNSASPGLEAQGRSCRDRRSAPPNVLAHNRVCRRSFTRRPRA